MWHHVASYIRHQFALALIHPPCIRFSGNFSPTAGSEGVLYRFPGTHELLEAVGARRRCESLGGLRRLRETSSLFIRKITEHNFCNQVCVAHVFRACPPTWPLLW